MDNRKQEKARKELEDTRVLVDYLTFHDMDFDDIGNFSDAMVKTAKEWAADLEEEERDYYGYD